MNRIALALALAVAGSAAAEPSLPLGESSKGPNRTWQASSSGLVVTPIWVLDRGGQPFIDDWEASVDGVDVDHARFYELVDRPDLGRTRKLRVGLGVLAIAGGLAAGVLGAHLFVDDGHGAGLALLFGGALASFGGAFVMFNADPISAAEAKQLADDHRVVVGYGGRF